MLYVFCSKKDGISIREAIRNMTDVQLIITASHGTCSIKNIIQKLKKTHKLRPNDYVFAIDDCDIVGFTNDCQDGRFGVSLQNFGIILYMPFVSCFNEPYGIGGHAICSNITQNSCLRCLYTDLISNELVPFRASLVKGGQNFKRNISGCTGAFVPYNALDTQQTALISTKLVLDILCEKISENKIISWLGSSEELVKNGFETAPYFKTNSENEKYIVEKEQFGNRNCLVCGRREVEVLFKREY